MVLDLAGELAPYTEDEVVPAPGNLHILALMRNNAAIREAEIAHGQEWEREKERE